MHHPPFEWYRPSSAARLAVYAPLLTVAASLAAPSPSSAQQTLILDRVYEGVLDSTDPVQGDGTYYDRFVIPCRAGLSLHVTLRSTDFDAYLTAAAPESTEWLKDDDGAGGTDSAIVLTPQTSGTCQVAATSYRPESGSYSLVVSLGSRDLTVPPIEDVLAEVVARSPTPIVTSRVGELSPSVPLTLGSLRLEAGRAYSVVAVVEGTAPLSADLRVNLLSSPSVEELLSASPDRDVIEMTGYRTLSISFEAPELPRGETLLIAVTYPWDAAWTPARTAAIVLLERPR